MTPGASPHQAKLILQQDNSATKSANKKRRNEANP
jgi:hypothetical protein